MKKFAALTLSAVICLSLFTACGGKDSRDADAASYSVDNLTAVSNLSITLPASVAATGVEEVGEAFKTALNEKLAENGYTVENIDLTVGTSDTAVCESLADGSTDLAFIAASKYLSYAENIQPIAAAESLCLSNDGKEPAMWNGASNATEYEETAVPYGRTLVCTTTSPNGIELSKKFSNGSLTFADLASASWAILKTDTSSDFIYPDLWLTAHYGQTTADLTNVITLDGYSALFTLAANESVDIIVIGADKRIDYAECWQMGSNHLDMSGKMGLDRTDSIFDAVSVIGVSEPIYGDPACVTLANDELTDEFKSALTAALISVGETDEGKALYSLCGYVGFAACSAEDYSNIEGLALTSTDN